MKKLVDELNSTIVNAISDAISTSEEILEVIDKILQDYLDKSSCGLRFEGGKATSLVSLGDLDVCRDIETDIYIDSYEEYGILSEVQYQDVIDQIKGIDAFIARLNIKKAKLQEQAKKW